MRSALTWLSVNVDHWDSNLATFMRMDPEQRRRWWYRARQQANKGVPAMQTLLLKVIELRMKS